MSLHSGTAPADPVQAPDAGGAAQPLLAVRGLTKHFPLRPGLLDPTAGELVFDGQAIGQGRRGGHGGPSLKECRRQVQMVFMDLRE